MAEDNNSRWQLLSRLKTVVNKITFLINSDVNRWKFVSSFNGGSNSRRRLSFGQGLGLTAIVSSGEEDDDEDDDDNNNVVGFSDHSSGSSQMLQKTKSFSLQRSTSFPEEDDVDKRAQMFIDNFYRQLRLERQVSLQLRYKRNMSIGSSSLSNSP
ncbi:Protein of unknown function DUF761, plant [Cynara cardunculus var. scolymus]|uniref:Cotton fiber protein n=1 Tax=Cynara cardunculus var. scolymus TaxID=59895 RepID=A0A103Y2P9_CYNCS|nr:Protein of unknown function DUF761, plant [Cynara cardunculus var. scolymus]